MLRKRFKGLPEHVINYFFFVAEEVRELMAAMGFRTIDEMIGRSDLLDKERGDRPLEGQGPRLHEVFHKPEVGPEVAIRHVERQEHPIADVLDRDADRAGARRARDRRRRSTIEARDPQRRPHGRAPCCPAKSRSATATRACRTTPSR